MLTLKRVMKLMVKYNLDESLWIKLYKGESFTNWDEVQNMTDDDFDAFIDCWENIVDLFPAFDASRWEWMWQEAFHEVVQA